MSLARRYPIAFYLIAAFVITWLAGLAVYLALDALQDALGTDVSGLNDIVLRFGPSLAGILTVGLLSGRDGLRDLFRRCIDLRFPAILWLAAILIPPLILIVALVARGYGADTLSLDPVGIVGVFIVQLLLNTFLGGGLGEEIGWRGFMLPRLTDRVSPLVASGVVAAAWFAWHLPAYLFLGKADSDPIFPFAISIAAFSIVLTWAHFRSNGSLFLPILIHGAINASYYTLQEILPTIVGSATFQPYFDWVVAGLWCIVAVIVVSFWREGSVSPDEAAAV
jgi:membrane protease YdiL (CAAX protease family)